MRIVYLHQYFVKPDMSGGTRSFDMAAKLAQAGHEVHLITTWRGPTDRRGTGWFVELVSGFQVHWLPVPYSNSMGVFRRMIAFLKFALRAGRRAREIGADIIFATSTPLTVAIPAVSASRKLGVPMVFEVRDLWPELPIAMGVIRNPLAILMARGLERHAYRNARHIVALSPGMADGVVSAGVARSRISVIPNIANNALFTLKEEMADEYLRARPELRGRPMVLYSGAIGQANGVDYLVRMAAHLADRSDSPAFVIAGDGKFKPAVVALADSLRVLNKNVFIQEPLPKREMPGLLAAATVATSLLIDLPELANSSPNKFFDALAAGKPVLINWRGWLADLVRAEGAGLFVAPGRPDLAATDLLSFLADKDRLRRAGTIAKRLATEQFDKEVLAGRLVSVLETAVRD